VLKIIDWEIKICSEVNWHVLCTDEVNNLIHFEYGYVEGLVSTVYLYLLLICP
jgi:hypothetical protein